MQEDMQQKVSHIKEDMQKKLSHMQEGMQQKVSHTQEDIQQKMSHIWDEMSHIQEELQEKLSHIEEQEMPHIKEEMQQNLSAMESSLEALKSTHQSGLSKVFNLSMCFISHCKYILLLILFYFIIYFIIMFLSVFSSHDWRYDKSEHWIFIWKRSTTCTCTAKHSSSQWCLLHHRFYFGFPVITDSKDNLEVLLREKWDSQ